MDDRLLELIHDEVPKLTDDIVNGYVVREMEFAEQYVDEVIRCAEASFPEGVKYIGPKRIPPHIEYIKATESRSTKPTFDVSRSDRYMVAYTFEYLGEKITQHVYLPFVRDAGIINLKGATFSISPVLADKGISLGTNNAFVQVLRSKMTFNRHVYHFMANNVPVRTYIASGKLHHRSEKKAEANGAPGMKANTTNAHYLFGKYGIHGTFRMFNDTEVHIGGPNFINEDNFPDSFVDEDTGEETPGWVVCSSIGYKPTAIRRREYYPTTIRMALREEDFADAVVRGMVGAFFYVADLFPERFNPMDPDEFDGSEHEIRFWRILLGKIIGGVAGGDGEVARDISEHYKSLDSFIDEKTKRDLERGDIFVDDLYELVVHIQEILCQATIQPPDAISSMADKQLMVLRYVLSDINDKIFWMLFQMYKKVSQGRELTINDVRKIIQRQLSTETIMKLRNGGKHGEVTSVASPGDNKFFKITRNVVLQTDSSGLSRKNKKAPTDESKHLHASQLEYGSPTVLPKSEPTGRQINPTARLGEDGELLPRPQFTALINSVQADIRR